MIALVIAMTLALLLWPAESRATECWNGWGYWIEPGSHRYKSERLPLVTRGAAAWAPGQAVTLYFLEGDGVGISEAQPPITAVPVTLRFSRRERLSLVTGIATVAGRDDQLSFGLSHIDQLVTGIERLDAFYRWACSLEPGS